MKSVELKEEFIVDKERVKRSFSRQAGVYDQYAQLQQQIGRDLLQGLKQEHIPAAKIMDIGMGTAWLTQDLSSIYPDAVIAGFDLAWGMVKFAADRYKFFALQADAERLPFKKGFFDLAVSNLTYQWVTDLQTAFNEVSYVLTPGAHFKFTTLGPRTLCELHDAYLKTHQKVGILAYPHGQRFSAQDEIFFSLHKAGFSNINIQVSHNRQVFDSAMDLARALKNIGAANALFRRPAGLGGRLLFREMTEYYHRHYSCPEGIYAGFEVFFVEAVKKENIFVTDYK